VEWIVNEAARKGQVMGVRLSMTSDDAEDALDADAIEREDRQAYPRAFS
jgi:hypothetical protein